MIYAQDQLTDGFIPDYEIESFGVRAANKRKVAAELCATLVPGKGPLWHKVSGGYQIHDYLDWNDSKAEILAKRAGTSNRVQRYRDRLNASRDASRNASRDASLPLYNDAGNASQSASRDGEQGPENALRDAGGVPPSQTLPPYHDPQTHTPRAREAGEPPRGRRRQSLLTGTLPSDHVGHVWCGNFRKCVPHFLHTEFIGALGGDPSAAGQKLVEFYETTMAAIGDDAVISEPAPQFWRARFQVAFPSTVTPPVTPRRSAVAAGSLHTEVDVNKYAGRMIQDDDETDLTEQSS